MHCPRLGIRLSRVRLLSQRLAVVVARPGPGAAVLPEDAADVAVRPQVGMIQIIWEAHPQPRHQVQLAR
jgi:hypothetical protein